MIALGAILVDWQWLNLESLAQCGVSVCARVYVVF